MNTNNSDNKGSNNGNNHYNNSSSYNGNGKFNGGMAIPKKAPIIPENQIKDAWDRWAKQYENTVIDKKKAMLLSIAKEMYKGIATDLTYGKHEYTINGYRPKTYTTKVYCYDAKAFPTNVNNNDIVLAWIDRVGNNGKFHNLLFRNTPGNTVIGYDMALLPYYRDRCNNMEYKQYSYVAVLTACRYALHQKYCRVKRNMLTGVYTIDTDDYTIRISLKGGCSDFPFEFIHIKSNRNKYANIDTTYFNMGLQALLNY